MSDTFKSFSTNSGSLQNDSFLESNSLVSKFAFLLLAILGFIILLRIGISVLTFFLQPSNSPQLINGMVNGNQQLTFIQDPSVNGAVTIYRSNNAQDGIEFTWSIWLLIESISTNSNLYQHIFSKGNSNLQSDGLIFPNNAPGLYLTPNKNELVVIMNTYDVINEEITISDIPINKWLNVIIRCQNNTLDVYINGTIARSINLVGVPKQNYGDVYVALNGGFDGNISNLWYYNYALGTTAIQKIASTGPNTTLVNSNSSSNSSDYLSMKWFFAGSGDTYNPTE
jgi:hypothetical protein